MSVAQDGTQADGASQSPGVSAGAQRIVFASSATNLVPGDANGLRDVFLVERASGQVVRLSDASGGGDADGASDMPAVDDAGRVVAYATLATNLVPALASSTTSQIVVVTLPPVSVSAPAVAGPVVAAGVINVTDVLKQIASGTLPPGTATVQPGDGASTQPEVCGNGTCVGYATGATNLTPNDPDTNGTRDVVKQPVATPPPPAPPEPARISRDTAGNQASEATTRIVLSADGTVAAMESAADLTPQAAATNPASVNVFVWSVPLTVATVSRLSARTDVSEVLTLTGAGFQAGAAVVFGATAVPGTVEDAGRRLTVMTPATPAQPVVPGVVSLTVRNPDGSTVGLFSGVHVPGAAEDRARPGHGCRRAAGRVGNRGGAEPAGGGRRGRGEWRPGRGWRDEPAGVPAADAPEGDLHAVPGGRGDEHVLPDDARAGECVGDADRPRVAAVPDARWDAGAAGGGGAALAVPHGGGEHAGRARTRRSSRRWWRATARWRCSG